jgi:hypothetical protein
MGRALSDASRCQRIAVALSRIAGHRPNIDAADLWSQSDTPPYTITDIHLRPGCVIPSKALQYRSTEKRKSTIAQGDSKCLRL